MLGYDFLYVIFSAISPIKVWMLLSIVRGIHENAHTCISMAENPWLGLVPNCFLFYLCLFRKENGPPISTNFSATTTPNMSYAWLITYVSIFIWLTCVYYFNITIKTILKWWTTPYVWCSSSHWTLINSGWAISRVVSELLSVAVNRHVSVQKF